MDTARTAVIAGLMVLAAGCACDNSDAPRDAGRADADLSDALDAEARDSGGRRDSAMPMGCSALEVRRLSEVSVTRPSRVSAFFRVMCGDEGVAGLDFPSNFRLFEDGMPVSVFESTPLVVPNPQDFEIRSLLLLDLSGSITGSTGGIEELRSAAQAYIRALLEAGLDYPVAVYTFDGRATIQPLAPFGSSSSERDAAISAFACDGVDFCVDPSTDLNGSVIQGLELLDAERRNASAPFVETFLVVFSDGFDQAGRVPFTAVQQRLAATESRVFAVGIEGEPGEAVLQTIGRDGYQAGASVSELSAAFQAIAGSVADLAGSYYRVDYCSPKRAGTHELRVDVIDTRGRTGSTSGTFNAEGFTYGCVADPRVCDYGRADCNRDGTCDIDLATDSANCGGCGASCALGYTCRAGRCAPLCVEPEVECAGDCVDYASDPENCGECGYRCNPYEHCALGLCACAAPYQVCDGVCTDVATDPLNCGGCGSRCAGPGQSCVAGECRCSDPGATYCTDQCLSCGSGVTSHCGTYGPSLCCASPFAVACDDPRIGTQCWTDGVDCSTIQECGGQFRACYAGNAPHCGVDGLLTCCPPAYPTYCDPARFAGGGCWNSGVDCRTIVTCPDGRVVACDAGFRVDCASNRCVR